MSLFGSLFETTYLYSVFMSIAHYSPFFLTIGILLYSLLRFTPFVAVSYVFMNIFVKLLKHIFAFERHPECITLVSRDFTFPMVDKYSMPSGHSAIAGFATALSYGYVDRVVMILLSILIFIQRVQYQCHTLLECIIGYGLGLAFGLFSNYSYNQHKNLDLSNVRKNELRKYRNGFIIF
jgi:membrane-associated phospholipid phosphatase